MKDVPFNILRLLSISALSSCISDDLANKVGTKVVDDMPDEITVWLLLLVNIGQMEHELVVMAQVTIELVNAKLRIVRYLDPSNLPVVTKPLLALEDGLHESQSHSRLLR